MNKTEVLERGIELITGDREKNYGSTHTNFSRIAALWSVVLDYDVDPHQVALCLAQLKVARLIETSDHEDSWCDGVGYLAIGAELATELPMPDWERELLQGEEPSIPKVGDWISTEEEYSSLPIGSQLGTAYYPQDRASGSTDVFWQKHSGGWDLPDREDGDITDASMAEPYRARMVLRVGAA